MLIAGLITQCGLTPGGNRAGTADGRAALTTAVRMVAGVHNGTADGGTDTHVTGAAGLTDVDILMVDVAYLTDGGHAVELNVAQLAAGQTDHAVLAFLGHQLGHIAGGAGQLGTLTGVQLHIVDEGTDGDVGQGRALPGLISAPAPETTVSPTFRPTGARM